MADVDQTVLIVDDDRAILNLLASVLEGLYTVIEAADGREAVERFRDHEEEIHVVLLDLGMPEMSGYETLAQMQVVDPDVKIIVITGTVAEQERLPGISAC